MKKLKWVPIALFLVCPATLSRVALGQSTCNVQTGTTSIGAWFSLPTSSTGLQKAEDLCTALAAAGPQTISQHFNTNAETYTWDCQTQTCTSTSTIPEPGFACGTACFCVEAGEGFEVKAASGQTIALSGIDSPYLVNIPGGFVAPQFGVLVSVPCSGSAMTYTQFCSTIKGAPASGLNIATVNPATGVVTSVNCAIGNAGLIPQGRAVRIRNASASCPASISFGGAALIEQTYCIVGTSDGVGWAWWIDDGSDGIDSGEPKNLNAGPLANGDPESAFASYFISNGNATCPGGMMQPDSNPNCFKISRPNSFTLRVGPAAALPTCGVTGTIDVGGACSFNPVIYRAPSPVPALNAVGVVVLVGLLLASGAILLRRRAKSTIISVSE